MSRPLPHRLIAVGIRDAGSSQDALAFALEEAVLSHAHGPVATVPSSR